MDQDMIARYGAMNLPRYTSYPTAPQFSAQVSEPVYRSWLAAMDRSADLSLYLHIPYCRSMCWYCGCHTTVTARDAPVARYLAALLDEVRLIENLLPARMAVKHVHFGGGSPTLLRPDQLRQLLVALRAAFEVRDDAEIAIEVDPRKLSDEMAAMLGEVGVNRASIGVQSFDPIVQRAINRMQSFETVAGAIERLRRAGIDSINFDLIYGLPLQTLGSCRDTVEQALRLEPDRLAVFGYAHVPGFKLHQRRIDAAKLPQNRARWEQARLIAALLAREGYVAVGLDHYARPDDSLAKAAEAGALHRNFQGYTTDACPALIGLGSSSISRLSQGYVQNVVLISEYEKRLREGRLPVFRGYALDSDDHLRAEVIERLMCDQKVDLAAVCARFGADAAALLESVDLEPLLGDGLIRRRGVVVEVAPEARPLVRAVAAAFDNHLPGTTATHAAAV